MIEPSAGVDRGVLAILNEAYRVETLEDGKTRTVLGFKPHLSPIKAAVLPLKRNHEGIVSKAKAIKQELQALGLGRVIYEDTGNIGKGYRRHDEVGTPLCITVDFQTIEEDDTVTVRDRDTMAQQRMPASELGRLPERGDPMMARAVIATIGQDRPGLVNELSEVVLGENLNIDDSRMTVLGGEFAVLMSVSGPTGSLDALETKLDALGTRSGFAFLFRRTTERASTRVSRIVGASGGDGSSRHRASRRPLLQRARHQHP